MTRWKIKGQIFRQIPTDLEQLRGTPTFFLWLINSEFILENSPFLTVYLLFSKFTTSKMILYNCIEKPSICLWLRSFKVKGPTIWNIHFLACGVSKTRDHRSFFVSFHLVLLWSSILLVLSLVFLGRILFLFGRFFLTL